ncbi:MAG: CDP-glycerol glycerophosphotransferase family protein [Clostridiales bacterium]|nr:CDP-glycerol glycerophosphotransferase family protein [Clostridiales bacterium]
MEYRYKFSVVIPVYNVEWYLEETLESVIHQTIGFEKNIQIILVNDGSPDHSEEICERYAHRYPDNIVYLKQENKGVSAARNYGMQYVQGKYVNFLDSDDKWTAGSFQAVYDFFEKHQNKIDLVSCPQKFFEAREDYHWLFFKYEQGSRIIDVLEKYTYVQMHVTASFVKAEVLKKHTFDENLKFAEDSKFVNSIILDKLKYGVVADALHLYRKRVNASSAIQNKGTSKEWYLDTPEHYYLELIQQSLEQYDTVILYIQYLILYDFQWRLRDDLNGVLTDEEQSWYKEWLRKMLQYMDDDLICHLDKMFVEYKLYALSLKYGRDIRKELVYRRGALYFDHIKMYSLQAKSLFSVDVLNIHEDCLELAGRIWCPFADDLTITVENDWGESFPVTSKPAQFRKAVIFGEEMMRVRGYEIRLPLEDKTTYKVYGQYKDNMPQRLFIKLGKFSHLSPNVEQLYFHNHGFLVYANEDSNELILKKKHGLFHMKKELALLHRCLKDKKYEIAGFRILSHVIRPFLRKERWLVMERINVAGDNAEHFYKYLRKRKEKGIKTRFTIAKDSVDYEKMRKIGPVLPFRGFHYKLYVLLSQNIISSQGEDNIFNPWDDDSEYIRDLYKYNFIFLQHGIIKDDLSQWLNRFNKNLQMFVTSAKPEYESIIRGDYFYDESVVKLTGLPRYDNLKQDITPEKTILILPTWRAALACRLNNDTGERIYNPLFKQSDFYQFYNRLIHDERLIALMKEKGYRGKFFLHTHHKVQLKDFQGNDTIEVMQNGIDYQEEFQKNALLLTDFSSVAFDFAYLKKPVIYAQFDRETFFKGQVYSEGYFDYERDGLGPVCYDYEETVQTLMEAIRNDCKLDSVYDERSNAFYRWFDEDNCKRVYEEIRRLD